MNMQVNTQSLEDQIRALQAENAKLKAASVGKLTLKVSEKGGLSVYGMGKWPITLYRSQWERLLSASDAIKAFIEANSASLTVKD